MYPEEKNSYATPEQYLQRIFKNLDKDSNEVIIITSYERDMMIELLNRI